MTGHGEHLERAELAGAKLRAAYEVLGVEPGCNEQQVRAAYDGLVRAYGGADELGMHSLLSGEEKAEALVEVREAFALVCARLQTVPTSSALRAGASAVEPPLVMGASADPTSRSAMPRTRMFAATCDDPDCHKQVEVLLERCGGEFGGGFLVALRDIFGVTRHDIQENVKISMGHIEALEAENFAELPPTIYVKGFLKNYLRFMKFRDIPTVVNSYLDKLQLWQKNSGTSL